MSAGLALPGVVTACSADGGAADSYQRRLTVDYDLTTAQQRQLKIVLERQDVEELEVCRNEFQSLPKDVQDAIIRARRRVEERIRALLDPDQLRRFDAATTNSSR